MVAMEIGGWSDRATMDRIYTHVSKRTKDSYQNAFTDYFKPPEPEKEEADQPKETPTSEAAS